MSDSANPSSNYVRQIALRTRRLTTQESSPRRGRINEGYKRSPVYTRNHIAVDSVNKNKPPYTSQSSAKQYLTEEITEENRLYTRIGIARTDHKRSFLHDDKSDSAYVSPNLRETILSVQIDEEIFVKYHVLIYATQTILVQHYGHQIDLAEQTHTKNTCFQFIHAIRRCISRDYNSTNQKSSYDCSIPCYYPPVDLSPLDPSNYITALLRREQKNKRKTCWFKGSTQFSITILFV